MVVFVDFNVFYFEDLCEIEKFVFKVVDFGFEIIVICKIYRFKYDVEKGKRNKKKDSG